MDDAVLGIDIGTSSSKAVLVDLRGRVLASAAREHAVDRPGPGQVESDPATWWAEACSMSRQCLAAASARVVAVGVSGMGPCLAVADEDGRPLRPAVLYGVDTRATAQIARLTEQLGAAELVARTGAPLTTQAVGPKLAWLADHEPEVHAAARTFFMPSSWLVHRLTGHYVLDHHSASQCWPMYDRAAQDWYRPWTDLLAPGLRLPRLLWPGEVAGTVGAAAAAQTGLAAGTPVVAGTIDAWAEAVSVGAEAPGDLMVMYGTTLFLVLTTATPMVAAGVWGTNGVRPGTHSLAGGLATSGAITAWLRGLVGGPPWAELVEEARASGPGAGGLLALPYFAGERTPIADPDARGVVVGLTTATTRGDLYRAALEATAMGVRHNAEVLGAAAPVHRVVAVGGGVQGGLWPQVVSDASGMVQEVPRTLLGASYGGAVLAAQVEHAVDLAAWNPVVGRVLPDPALRGFYDERYAAYRALYSATRDLVHALVAQPAPAVGGRGGG